MRDLSQIKEKIGHLQTFFHQQRQVMTVYIFGSFGTSEQSPLSDIDLAVLFDSNLSLLDELRFAAEVSSVLGRDDVDVINLNKAPVYIQHRAIYSGSRIYEKTPEKTQDFIENVLEEYHDYEFIYRKFQDDCRLGLMEEYLDG
ncbi:MAG TPA: nucleotidyltransferase domain-containing protein [Firmicutes bacterium]|jgi:uncharacterized protein|nr:nucleotidyltransferase domain-containing protein [Bacillota bacterium]